tara:strand:- start:536 stop:1777 length:1242 start_codon:yes stop_codon:yes gene_type:complete
MRFVFFSFRNFERDGGGSIRMYGILNSLAANNSNRVVFISNAKDKNNFHPNIQHQSINLEVSNKSKKILQGLTSFLPAPIIFLVYSKLLKKVKTSIDAIREKDEPVYFFEYLDNTIGYLLNAKDQKYAYINDIHGISTIEFKYQYQNATKIINKTLFYFKYIASYLLDKKVFSNANGFIYASDSMKEYYQSLYKGLDLKRHCVLPYLLGDVSARNSLNSHLGQELKKRYKINEKDFILFFAGGYKPTAGVEDLILAFDRLYRKHQNLKMILIGEGPNKEQCLNLIKEKQIGDRIILINRVPYQDLPTYQNIANVVVCPDKQNPYSELIVHLKYFDSLSSGKIVINGGFKSVKEINKNEFLALNFIPSDVNSLTQVIEHSITNYEVLIDKFKSTQKYTLENLTYASLINRLYTL